MMATPTPTRTWPTWPTWLKAALPAVASAALSALATAYALGAGRANLQRDLAAHTASIAGLEQRAARAEEANQCLRDRLAAIHSDIRVLQTQVDNVTKLLERHMAGRLSVEARGLVD